MNTKEILTRQKSNHSHQSKGSDDVASIEARTPSLAGTRLAATMRSAGIVIFLTGLSGAGKTTVADELGARLRAIGYRITMLDGDELRTRVSPDLGFSRADREANLRRAGLIASEVVKHGGIAICSFIAPYEQSRREIRQMVMEHGTFFLVHVATPLQECERRDPKGLYQKARAGLMASFTGISDVYEPPVECDLTLDTTGLRAHAAAERVLRALAGRGLSAGFWIAASLPVALAASSHEGLEGNSVQRRHTLLLHRVLESAGRGRISLQEISSNVEIGRHTIEKVVRSLTGYSFRELQGSLLLERANVLLETGRPIKEIAFEMGFASVQSFHRFIRRTSGSTPSSLRGSAATLLG